MYITVIDSPTSDSILSIYGPKDVISEAEEENTSGCVHIGKAAFVDIGEKLNC